MALIITQRIISDNRVTIPRKLLYKLCAQEGDFLELEIRRIIRNIKSEVEVDYNVKNKDGGRDNEEASC